jgi:predicted Co/Zn/Cd cation transporter (cation efflux family)
MQGATGMGETRALTLSALAALGLGGLALALALAARSGAILLDAAYNLSFFATALLTLRIARLLRRPDDARYPFGYLAFEPLINLVKGLLMLGVAGFALVDAGGKLARGGVPLEAGLALAYAAAATLACGAVLLALRRAPSPSPLVRADIENWTVNLAVSGGMAAAFLLALVLQRAGRDAASQLVDPILVGLVVVLTLPVPARMALRALQALLNRAPDPGVTASVEAAVRGALGDLAPRALYVRVLRPGRTTYATAHVVLAETDAGLEVRRADTLRRAAVAAVAKAHHPVILDMVFTAVDAFAAPTAGMTADPEPAGG